MHPITQTNPSVDHFQYVILEVSRAGVGLDRD